MEINKELTNITRDDFIDDSTYRKLSMLSKYGAQKDIINLKDSIMANRKSMIENVETLSYLDEALNDYTEDDLKKMSDEEIEKLFDGDEGDAVKLKKPNEDTVFNTQFKRDFLIFQKQAQDAMVKIAEEEEKLNKELAECMEEFDDAVQTYSDVQTLVKSTILEKIASAKDDHERELYQNIMIEYDNGYTLNNLIKYCQSYKAKNIYSDFVLDNDKTDYIYRRFLKECDSLGIENELTRFVKLESRFLPEKYHDKDNLFMFAVIHYIASWRGKNTNISRGLFITEFMINIKNLFYNKFEHEEDKETFCNNIMKVLDLILQ